MASFVDLAPTGICHSRFGSKVQEAVTLLAVLAGSATKRAAPHSCSSRRGCCGKWFSVACMGAKNQKAAHHSSPAGCAKKGRMRDGEAQLCIP
jgi:hypothetical protein